MKFELDENDGIGNHLQKFPVWCEIGRPPIQYRIKGERNKNNTALFDKLVEIVGTNESKGGEFFSFRGRKKVGNEFKLNCEHFGFNDQEVCKKWLPVKWEVSDHTIPYDVVLCNGSANEDTWIRKRYHRWNEVIEVLINQGYSVACIGTPMEYVYPAVDLTHLDIVQSADIVSQCKLALVNDTAFYHFANIIGKQNIVVFTATSRVKNCNEFFHAYSYVIIPGVGCDPCGPDRPGSGVYWDNCSYWKCAMFDPKIIIDTALEALNGSK